MKLYQNIEIPETFDELADCVQKKHNSTIITEKSLENRNRFANMAKKFHLEANTLTNLVKENIEFLERKKECIFLFSAHQPNLLPYSGIVRKLTLMEALKIRLAATSSIPVISLFSISDEALPDRWVKNAQLPDVMTKDGCFGISNPEIKKKHHNRLTGYGKYTTKINSIPKPTPETLSTWIDRISSWIRITLKLIRRLACENGCQISNEQVNALFKNTKEIIEVLEDSYKQARNYADLNAFLLSKIINESFGYSTLFVRYSESKDILKDEISLLSHDYERYLEASKEALDKTNSSSSDIELAPFWYHCECGGMANLLFHKVESTNFYQGDCINCGKNHKFDIEQISSETGDFFSNISLRAIPFMIVYFEGLRPDLFVGGNAGLIDYYPQAKTVVGKLGTEWPVIGIWNPYDRYSGIGQLHAFLAYKETLPSEMKKKIFKVFQDKHSIVDYAINIGLKKTSQQWLDWLRNKNGNSHLESDVCLDSVFAGKLDQDFFEFLRRNLPSAPHRLTMGEEM